MTETTGEKQQGIDAWQQIRVPAKVVRYWSERMTSAENTIILFCGLDDGRVYLSVKVPCTKGETGDGMLENYTREWVLHTPAMENR